jgi:tetratricopeptide (TPR) repeat protein
MGRRVKCSCAWKSVLPLFIIAIIFSLTGCSVMKPVGNFFGQQYVNTVSYFNTFYNAKHLFDEALADVETARRRHQHEGRTGPLELNQQVREKFNKVIEKCSRLLSQHPNSRYADNAVLMIGQSYYHMNQNVQAERKFLELLAEFPDSRLTYDAQYLLARTQRRMNKLDEARITLTDLLNRTEGRRHRDLIAQARIELGDVLKSTDELQNALEEYRLASETARDRTLRTEADFKIATLYQQLGETEAALSAYEKVIDGRPTNHMLFEAKIAHARILTDGGSYEEAIDLLESLLTELRLVDYISSIELEAAHVYHAQGAYDRAVDQYVYVDTTYARTRVSTQASNSLAMVYEQIYGDYARAKEYYQKVERSTPPSDMTRNASVKRDQLERYRRYKDGIARLDSTITALHDSLVIVENLPPRPVEVEPQDTTGIEDPLNDTTSIKEEVITPDAIREEIDSTRQEMVRSQYELAGLFYLEMERPDSAMYYYADLAQRHPESPYAPQSLYALAELVRSASEEGYEIAGNVQALMEHFDASDPLEKRDTIYRILIDRHPGTRYATEAKRLLGMDVPRVQTDPMEPVYLEAEREIADGRYEDALLTLEYIARNGNDSKFVPQARFAIGWIYENILLKPDSAYAYYQSLVEQYPETQFATAVQGKITAWDEQKQAEELQQREEEAEEASEVEEESEQPDRPLPRPVDAQTTEVNPDTTGVEPRNED